MIKSRSRVVQLASRIKALWPALWVWPLERRPLDEFAEGLKPPTTPEYRRAWAVTDALVTATYQDVRHHDAEFLLVVLSDPLQVYPDPKVRERLQREANIVDPFYINLHLSHLGERKGFAVLSLGEPFLAYAQAHHVFLHGFNNFRLGVGHWNVEGHRLAGELIATKLCTVLHHHTASSY